MQRSKDAMTIACYATALCSENADYEIFWVHESLKLLTPLKQ